MAKKIECFKDFLSELLLVTNDFNNLAQSDKKAILDYILKNSAFLSYLTKEQSDFLSVYAMAFLLNYDCLIKYNPEQKDIFEIPFEELSEEVINNLNEILLDILEVMEAKNIYQSSVNSFCYNLEQRLITNANEYLKDIYSELFIEMEKCFGGIYSILGKAAAKGKNVESLKAAIIMEFFIYQLVDVGYSEEEDMAFFAEILAHY
ncbi:hypothetical protein [Campylobacter sp.]|uniref:hypothetical protein n=1 Tax=Campylobacter sp. TaxID=205 RepID=UPI002AA71D1A|nr:hypothetical protein [Campylobacter sp.]MCI6662209.1 hypothetical protein [Campylobacter sp.]